MDKNKRDQQQREPQQHDQRQMAHEQNRDLDTQRNEEETGKPVQLDKDATTKEHQGGKDHQGNQPRHPETEHQRPDQGQRTGQR